MNFKDTPLRIHRNLTRAQSSVAIQLRSEHIGLNSYLSRRKVRGVEKPSCPCGYPSQNVKHMVLACPQWANGRGGFLRQAKDRSFEAMMNSPEDMARITQWILNKGWIKQFRLAGEVEVAMSDKVNRSGRGKDGIHTG
ncbi:hypothetical protein BGHDH14_bgh03408 [Blumeria hordei DH14]|uniref:Reverse transcriptase n=1 Tax=Blumeria graminis f. sp. hordei (strain DH14) TaxID=546991 RepID=N1J8Z5_BLUG1|nr:hypothetical protein BGHDH14_bgh03408 [Blumeria hordei DH14]